MEALIPTKFTFSVGNKQTVRDLLMDQFRNYIDAFYDISAEKAMESNNKRLHRLLKLLQD